MANKVVSLPGSAISPKTLLGQTLDDIENVAGIVMVVRDSDNYFRVCTSDMKISDLCMSDAVLDRYVKGVLDSTVDAGPDDIIEPGDDA